MTDTPEMTEWLNRIKIWYNEKGIPTKSVYKSLDNLGDARQLLHQNLGYDITRKQFEGLKEAREAEAPQYQVKIETIRYKDKYTAGRVHYRTVYRNGLGQFVKNPNK
jgi:hypothetical protein